MSKLQVKICGINHPEALSAALEGGVRFVGLVFYPRSPRAVSVPLAAELARMIPTGVRTVGLFVDPTDGMIDEVLAYVPLDLIQLHDDSPPERVGAIRARFGIQIMKVFRIATASDLDAVPAYVPVADRLLFDARPPAVAGALPGGNGVAFDWRLLAGRNWPQPWMLSGGLTAATLAEAVTVSGARAVDVSSGVEDRPGHKDPALIRAFLTAAARL